MIFALRKHEANYKIKNKNNGLDYLACSQKIKNGEIAAEKGSLAARFCLESKEKYTAEFYKVFLLSKRNQQIFQDYKKALLTKTTPPLDDLSAKLLMDTYCIL